MLVRAATPSDRENIIRLDHAAQQRPERIQFVDRALSSADCVVVESYGEVVAYAVLEYSFFGNGFVSMLYVAEAVRRQGIGRNLMEALALRCKTPKLFTSTNQSNKPMQQLLEALGYLPSGVIHNLDIGDPELVYFLDLQPRAVFMNRADSTDRGDARG